MKLQLLIPLIILFISQGITAQVKLGDNPQSIDPASLFELESSDQVLVITRVTSEELAAISPSMGALAYNTDEQCLFYHNGDTWINLCDALGRAFTTEAIVNEFPTVVITPLEESINFEVGQIRSENIVDFSIGSQDIQNNSINSEKLAEASVGAAELQDNTVTGRTMDFVDITLSDFINDVPFLIEGNVVAAAIQYDNTSSGLGASDLQVAIDLLSTGLAGVGLQSNGDGTYVFTNSDGTLTDLNLNAAALPFDSSSNGLTANTVQEAIEEIQGGSSDNQTLTLNSPNLEIEDGNSVDLNEFLDNTDEQDLTLDGTFLAIENGNAVDLSGLTSGVNTDNQQITEFSFEPTTNSLTLEIQNATSETVNLSSLVGGDADGSETRILGSSSILVEGIGTDTEPYSLSVIGGGGGTGDLIAAEVAFSPTVNTVSENVQAAIEELQTEIDGISSGGGTDDQIAEEVEFTPIGNTESTDVQAAIEELQTEIDGISSGGGTDDQIAAEVEFTPTGNTVSADVQAAIEELQTEMDGIDRSVPDPTDELISLFELNGTALEITEAGVLLPQVDLDPVFATDLEVQDAITASDTADGDTAIDNEIQVISSIDGTVGITQTGNDYDLSVPGSTDNQNLTGAILTGAELTISIEDGTPAVIDLDPTFVTETELTALSVDDADADPANELQNIESTDGSVTINQTGNDYDLSVSAIPVGTSGALFYSDGAGGLVDNPTQIFWDQANNRLGIGTNNPQNKLQVTGEVRSQGYSNSNGTATEPSYAFTNDTDTGMWRGGNANFLRFSTQGTEAMIIDPTQNIGIGINAPTERLHVNGNILANGTITPDYVFEKYFDGASGLNPDYTFLSLEEIHAFIRENNHLPGVPSAAEVSKKGGILLNRATEINLEKIEELFLYAIEQERKIDALQTDKTALETEVSELKSRLDRIEKLLVEKSKH